MSAAKQLKRIEPKEMPSAIELEEMVLGALMIDSHGVDQVFPLIKDYNVFYKPEHQKIYAAMQQLASENKGIDLGTLSFQLRTNKWLDAVGGDFALVELSQKVAGSAHIEYHCRIILQQWVKRQSITDARNTIERAYDDSTDIFDLLDYRSNRLDNINNSILKGSKQITWADAATKAVERVKLLTELEENEFNGLPTGFNKIDRFTGGWQKTDLIIVAARPGMGKTALVLKNAVEVAKAGKAVGFVSLEMSTQQLLTRCISIDSNLHLRHLMRDGFKDRNGELEANHLDYYLKLKVTAERVGNLPIYCADKSSMTINDLYLQARAWKRQYNIQILFVDYIQLMSGDTKSGNREQEISTITRKLKALAKELDIPVVALSQLNRSLETRGGTKRPKLSDLRESGSIEQDADIVTFIYRPEYYGYNINDGNDEWDHLIKANANTEFIFAKYRSGSLATKCLYFDDNKTKFMDPIERDNETDVPF